jgi:hypothetical protein
MVTGKGLGHEKSLDLEGFDLAREENHVLQVIRML